MNDDQEVMGLGIHQSNKDKLTYKNIISDAINTCRRSKGLKEFVKDIEALEDIIYMDISGYRLRKEIEDIKEIIRTIGQEYINTLHHKSSRDYYKRVNIAKLRLFMDQWYYEKYFKELIQLLATHNLLLEHERYIPIREKSILTDYD